MRVMAHGVVDAPDLHDGDDRARGLAVRNGEIGAHLAVAQLHLDVLRLHVTCLSELQQRPRVAGENLLALGRRDVEARSPRRWCRRSAPAPASESNGASVANRQRSVPKKAWPQIVGADIAVERRVGIEHFEVLARRLLQRVSAPGLRSGAPKKICLKPSLILTGEIRDHAAHVVA